MNGRNTYEFLTDEGLIPNYAFPEKGVTLRSVIYRRREPDAGEGDGYDHEVYEYERPPSAALGELAPENEFYAGARHVSITRIDTRVSGIEVWRLCRSCAYCEKLEPRDDHTVCPRCGDPMWSDEGQRHNMLPLRLVHAAAEDRRSRIVDDRDDREPLFCTRHLVADFEPNSIEQAYAVANPNLPFGFEYIRSATFREMNFGRVDDAGNPRCSPGESFRARASGSAGIAAPCRGDTRTRKSTLATAAPAGTRAAKQSSTVCISTANSTPKRFACCSPSPTCSARSSGSPRSSPRSSSASDAGFLAASTTSAP